MPRVRVSSGALIRKAIEEGLSYEMAQVKYGIRIRKQAYLALKKVVTGKPLTERQRKEIKRLLSKEKQYKDIIEEFKLKNLLKRVYVADGTVILSTTHHTGRYTDVYSEAVIDIKVIGDAQNYDDMDDFINMLAFHFQNVYRSSLKDALEDSPLVKALPIRVDFHEDTEFTEDLVLSEEFKGPVMRWATLYKRYTSLLIDKEYRYSRKTYDYSKRLLKALIDHLRRRKWNIEVIGERNGKKD